MPDRIHSASDTLDTMEIDSYALFEDTIEEKEIAIWQPCDHIDNLYGVPNPADRMKTKAARFLQTVNETGCHMAVAPEWAYNINWVTEHSEYLFADETPLFILGCSPMEYPELERAIGELEEHYHCYYDDKWEDRQRTFMTPAIVPLRTASRDNGREGRDAVLIQFKNEPMGDNENINEVADMGRGQFIWTIDPNWVPLKVIPLTCSDILDYELRQEVARYARSHDAIIAHIQLNPHPFHSEWRRFRGEIFASTNIRTTYIAANWNNILPISEDDNECSRMGYSAVYAKSMDDSQLGKYNQIYSRGGLPGTNPTGYYEFVWLLPENLDEDAISVFSYQSPNPADAGSGGPSIADPYIRATWIWNDGSFDEEHPGVPECNQPPCEQWRSKLPDEPLGMELVSSVASGHIDIEQFANQPGGSFHPRRDIRWSHLSNLKCNDDEKVGHILASHNQRTGTPPRIVCDGFNDAFEKAAEEENIRPMQDYEIDRLPLNAELDNDNESVCVSVVGEISSAAREQRKDWIANWWGLVDPFRSYIVYMDHDSGLTIEEGPKHERVDGAPSDPRSVDASGGPMEGEG